MTEKPTDRSFEEAASSATAPTLLAEFWEFLRHNKKWWLLPILIVLLLFGVLIFLSGTGAAPSSTPSTNLNPEAQEKKLTAAKPSVPKVQPRSVCFDAEHRPPPYRH